MMLPLKSIKLNDTNYLIFTLCSISILFTPVFLEFAVNYMNPNNSDYINEAHIKHYVKIFFSILFFAVLINIPFLFFNKWGKIIYFSILSLTLYISSFIDFIHVLIFQSGTNSSSWYSIFSTHKSESLEFIFDYSSIKLVIGIIFFIVISMVIYYIAVLLSSWKLKKILFIIFLACYIASLLFIVKKSEFSYINEISFFKFYNSYINYKKEIKRFNLKEYERHQLSVKKINFYEKETHIIIIGESTSKYHMQIYGYNRSTTPELDKIKNKLIIFNNVKASYAHTIASLKEALFLNDENSLVDLFNSAGVKTYWLSNQKFLGENETLISAMANRADKKIFINPIGENKVDGELLYELDKLLMEDAPQKVIFIHLMGTHLSYQNRYPVAFNHFTSRNISPFGDHADSFINHYDNAVLYNDFVVSEIIKRCDALEHVGSTTYFSDHGDEVYDFRNFHGHSQMLLSKYMTDIPFVVYLNNFFKKAMSKSFNDYSKNSNKEFSLNQFPPTLQDLLGFESDYFNETKSYFYNDTSILELKNIESGSTIINNPDIFPKFKSKIWAHRVNSIERFNRLQNKFKGIELDILYENGKFDVGHPPVESIGLTLDIYFENVKEIKEYYFWLDLKNLNSENEKIINRLNYLTKKYNNKADIIIETVNAQLISELRKAGYCTSYYLPDLAKLIDQERTDEINKIYKIIALYNISTISQSIENYKLMVEYFPKANKLIWALNLEWSDYRNHERIKNVLENDSTIKICLVNYTTKGWR